MDFYQDSIFRNLVRELLNEPYSQQRGFFKKPLEAICSEVESDGEIFLGTASSNIFEQEKEKESFQRVKSAVFLILSHLDLSGVADFPEANLGSFFPAEFSSGQSQSTTALVADFFRHLKTTQQFPLPPVYLDKVIAKHLIDNIEEMVVSLIQNHSDLIHQSREKVFFSCLSRTSQKTEFQQDWKVFFEGLLASVGLEISQAETKCFVDTFRLINSNPRPDSKHLNLNFLGVIVSAFGTQSNALPLVPEDSERLGALLFRLNQRKNEANSGQTELSSQWLSEVESDCSETLRLISKAVEGPHLIAA